MRAKRITAVMVTPVAAAALAFSPALMTQAAADTTQAPAASAPQVPEAKSPSGQGTADGKLAGENDGKRCNWGKSANPEVKAKARYKKDKDVQAYVNAFDIAYQKGYEAFDNTCADED